MNLHLVFKELLDFFYSSRRRKNIYLWYGGPLFSGGFERHSSPDWCCGRMFAVLFPAGQLHRWHANPDLLIDDTRPLKKDFTVRNRLVSVRLWS